MKTALQMLIDACKGRHYVQDSTIRSAEEELAALSPAPEDVARDYDVVSLGLEPLPSIRHSALSRLATAAARVPGLEQRAKEDASLLETRKADLANALSERDAARKEAEKDRERAIALGTSTAKAVAMKEHLTARVAELERKSLDLRVCAGEQNLRNAHQTVIYANANGARASAERDTAEARATAAEALSRAVYAKLEDARGVIRHAATEVNASFPASVMDDDWDAQPAPTPAPGLREAVGPFAALARENTHDVMADKDLTSFPTVRVKDARALLAAYDAAKGGEASGAEHGRWAKSGTGTVLHYFVGDRSLCGRSAPGGEWGPGLLHGGVCERCLSKAPEGPTTTPPSGPGGGETKDHEDWCTCAKCKNGEYHPDETPEPSTLTPEPVVTHAQLAAVVEAYARECLTRAAAAPGTSEEMDELRKADGAREVLRRVTGGEVPEVATWREKAAKWDAAVERTKDEDAAACALLGIPTFKGSGMPPSHKSSWRTKAQTFARWLLGLTLPTGPGGGETTDTEDACPECGHAAHGDAGTKDRAPHSYCPERMSVSSPACGCRHIPAPRARIAPTPTPEGPALDEDMEAVLAMSDEEVDAELKRAGFTDERLNAGLAKCMDMVRKAKAKTAPQPEPASPEENV